MKICITCEGISDTSETTCVHCATPLIDTDEVHFPARRGEADVINSLIGKVIGGKYRILNVLGKGGMGTVFRALHEVSLVPVALKVLHPRFALRPDYRAWFLAEARRAGRVVHENSARVQDVGEAHDGTIYIAVEYVDGVTLHEWLGDGRPLAPRLVVEILEQMARALAAAHEAGVVHRDLSPRNVMIAAREGRPLVKILDFGIAKGLPESLARRASEDGAPRGFASPPFSAPEYLEGREVDGRADLYSLGAIGYAALTGRLPVAGTTPHELVRATLDGEVRPLRGVSGAPPALLRLTDAMLARDPEDRPGSAREVATTLARIAAGGGRRLARVAVGSATLAAVAFGVAYAPASAAFLRVIPGSSAAIVLSDVAVADRGAAQELRSIDLRRSQFDYGGFDPARLGLEVSRAGESLRTVELGRVVVADGRVLRLRADQATELLLQTLARDSAGGPLDLKFVVAGQPPLGYARVRLDDTPPAVEFVASLGPEAALRGDSRVRLRVVDDGTLAGVRLSLSLSSDAEGTPRLVEIAPDELARETSSALALLGDELAGVLDHGAGRVRLEAVDRAGNRSVSAPIEFANLDLRVPEIRAVQSLAEGNRIVFGPGGADVRVVLTEGEAGVTVSAFDPDGLSMQCVIVQSVGDRIDMRMLPAAPDPLAFVDGRYRFQVGDALGNLSSEFVETLTFRSADPEDRLRELVGESSEPRGRVAWLGERQLLGDGAPTAFEFTCNPLYRPVQAWLFRSGSETVPVAVEGAGPGVGTLRLPSLDDGDYELRLRITDEREQNETVLPGWAIAIRNEPPVLSLPDTAGLEFLPRLEDLSVLRLVDGRLQQGAAWVLRPDDVRMVRGRVWFGVSARLESIPLPTFNERDALLLRGIEPQRGRHRLALELYDPLGREVVVRCGERIAPLCAGVEGARARTVAEFHYHDRPITLTEPVLRVEFKEAARLMVRSALPIPTADDARLSLSGAPLPAERKRTLADGGELLTFVLPFDRIVLAADMGSLKAEQYAAGHEFPMRARVATPAGEYGLELVVRTIRSTLAPVRLGTLARELDADSPLAGIRMVPVLGPGPGRDFVDPVSADAAGRGAFRTTPPLSIRSIGDVYLQSSELTRAQYWDAVTRGLTDRRLRSGERWREFVHATDPLGPLRLSESAMVPVMHAERPAAFLVGLASAPRRPVAGVDYFQAHTVARLCGFVLQGDPDLLRLPAGVELEIAALGSATDPTRPSWNGAAARGDGIASSAFATGAQRRAEADRWPLDEAELRVAGDVVAGDQSFEIFGLDCGLREWVLDLPFVATRDESRSLMREWLADHTRHLALTESLARGRRNEFPGDLIASFAAFGTVRGVAFGDDDVLRGRPDALSERLGPEFPAVVRSLHVRRNGEGPLPGSADPHLAVIGFRLAGGDAFVREVRSR